MSLTCFELTPSCQSSIRIRIHKEFHVEHLADIFVVEDENSLEENNIGGADGRELAGDSRVLLEVVDGHLSRLSLLNVLQTRDE